MPPTASAAPLVALLAAAVLAWTAPAGAAAPELCLVIAAPPQNEPLALVRLDAGNPVFTITYVHSVTRTPVEETYRADDEGLTETSIAFTEHGPGLPTEGAAGETWARRDDRFVVTMARRFTGIRMRVASEQQPALFAAGKSTALAQWGNRSLALFAAYCDSKPK
jgi:hypothetical protein